ncbi:hypothetical protein TGVAND_293660 [Toxoplasma gondii VAND]|uniref:RAP domain-containing protein n=1 Tax=Toxoplasma gondii VAND TaxID=933077 RepID=A0A086PSD8_TOXGO|nr:hypothetical protein TGVAND_293660 [Toxoplasma gondii VAND]
MKGSGRPVCVALWQALSCRHYSAKFIYFHGTASKKFFSTGRQVECVANSDRGRRSCGVKHRLLYPVFPSGPSGNRIVVLSSCPFFGSAKAVKGGPAVPLVQATSTAPSRVGSRVHGFVENGAELKVAVNSVSSTSSGKLCNTRFPRAVKWSAATPVSESVIRTNNPTSVCRSQRTAFGSRAVFISKRSLVSLCTRLNVIEITSFGRAQQPAGVPVSCRRLSFGPTDSPRDLRNDGGARSSGDACDHHGDIWQHGKTPSSYFDTDGGDKAHLEIAATSSAEREKQEVYINPVCMQMDQLLMQSATAEEVLTLLVSHRGVLFLHNLVTALELLADFATAESRTLRVRREGTTSRSAELQRGTGSQLPRDDQQGLRETTFRNPLCIVGGTETASGSSDTPLKSRATGARIEDLLPHLQAGQPLPSGWPKPVSTYESVTSGTRSRKELVTVEAVASEDIEEGNVMHGLGVADWIVRDERYEVLLQDLRFHRRNLSFDAAAKVVLSMRKLNHRHYPVLSAMLHPLARREIPLSPSYETSSSDTGVHGGERNVTGIIFGTATVSEESLEGRKRTEKILHERLNTLFQCADVYVWAGYIQHPFFDRVAALFFSALQQMPSASSNGAALCTSSPVTSTANLMPEASPSLLVRALQIFSSLRVNAGHEVFTAAAERILQHMPTLGPDHLVAVAAAVSKHGACTVLFPAARDQMQPSSLPNQHFASSDLELLGNTKGQIMPKEANTNRAVSVVKWPQKCGGDDDSVPGASQGSSESVALPASLCLPTPLLSRNTTQECDRLLRSRVRASMTKEAVVYLDANSATIMPPLQSIPDRVLTAVASQFEVASSSFSLSATVTLMTAFQSRGLHFPTCIAIAVARVTQHLRVAANVRQRAALTIQEIGHLLEACTFFGVATPTHNGLPAETPAAEVASGDVRGGEVVNSNTELIDAAAAYLEQHLDEISERTAIQVTFALAATERATCRHAYLLSFTFRKIGKGTEWQRHKVRVFQLWLSHVLQFPWLHYNMPQRCVFEGLRAWCMQRGGYGAPFPREVAELSRILSCLDVKHKTFVELPGSPYGLDILLESSNDRRSVILVTNECAPNTLAPAGGSTLQAVHLAQAGYSQILFVHQPTWNLLRSEESRVRFVLLLLQRLCPERHLAVNDTTLRSSTGEGQDTRMVLTRDANLLCAGS